MIFLYWDVEIHGGKLHHILNIYKTKRCFHANWVQVCMKEKKWYEEWADEFAYYDWFHANLCSYLVGQGCKGSAHQVQVYITKKCIGIRSDISCIIKVWKSKQCICVGRTGAIQSFGFAKRLKKIIKNVVYGEIV